MIHGTLNRQFMITPGSRKQYYERAFEINTENEWNAAPGKDVLISALKQALSSTRLSPDEALIDIGCGTGYLLNRVQQEVCATWRLTGVDFAETAIERGKLLYPGITFLCADGAATGLAAESFSVAISYGSMEHFPRPKDGVAEAGRVLRRGGLFLIMVPTLGAYRTDRDDEGWYEDFTGQPQWNLTRDTWESYFEEAGLSLWPWEVAQQNGALKPGNFYFGTKS